MGGIEKATISPSDSEFRFEGWTFGIEDLGFRV